MSFEQEYVGFKELTLSTEEMADFYEHMNSNPVQCLVNEYLIIYGQDGSVSDQLKWNGEKFVNVPFKSIT